MPKRRDQRGVRVNPLISSMTGRVVDTFLRKGRHKPGPEPVDPPGPGPDPPPPIICPCNMFKIADYAYSQMSIADRLPWRQALKKRKMSGYDLWMKECLVALMSTGYFPLCPSVSGGFSCNELVLSEDRPTPENTIGLAPEPEPPLWYCRFDDDFNRPDNPSMGENWTPSAFFIEANRVRLTTPFTWRWTRAFPGTMCGPDCDVAVTYCHAQHSSYPVGIYSRGLGEDTFYASAKGDGQIYTYLVVLGEPSLISIANHGPFSSHPFTCGIGQRLLGDQISIYILEEPNWILVKTFPYHALVWGSSVGLFGKGTRWALTRIMDNFSCRPVGGIFP